MAVARSCTCTTLTITITSTSSTPVTVAVDVNGADLGPAEVARGAAHAENVRVILFGPAAEIGPVPAHVSVVDAPVSIAKEADPARAVRRTPEASIVRAVAAVTDGEADALVSGGSTGAALAAALFGFKRVRGVHRPALAIMIPVPGKPFLLLDAGANVEVRPEMLVQFAHMGAAFMEAVAGVSSPRVALLANGTEATKGTEIVVAAHSVLASTPGLNFVGNVEGFAIGTGAADVIVADGFTGNVALKVMEGSSAALFGAVRGAATVLAAREGRRVAAQARAAGPPGRAGPGGAGRRGAAGAAAHRRGPARVVRGPRVHPCDRGRGPRRARGRGRPDPRPPGRGGGAAQDGVVRTGR